VRERERERERERDEAAIRRKTEKYQELREEARNRGYTAEIMTVEVRNQGVISVQGFKALLDVLTPVTKRDFRTFLITLEGPAVTSLYVCFFIVVLAVNVHVLHALSPDLCNSLDLTITCAVSWWYVLKYEGFNRRERSESGRYALSLFVK